MNVGPKYQFEQQSVSSSETESQTKPSENPKEYALKYQGRWTALHPSCIQIATTIFDNLKALNESEKKMHNDHSFPNVAEATKLLAKHEDLIESIMLCQKNAVNSAKTS